jgi:hypothetical protein
VHDRVEVWDVPRTMLVGLRVQLAPLEGETDDVKATVPVKPFTGPTVIVEWTVAPAVELMVVGFADTAKSLTVTVTVTE